MVRPKNSKSLLVIIAVLLALNIGGMLFFFAKTPSGKKMSYSDQRKIAMSNYLKTDCGFSAEQLVQYDSLAERHKREIQPVFDQLRKEKEQRIKNLAQGQFSDSGIALAVNKTLARQEEVETRMLLNLRDVRNLCNEQQRVKFDSGLHIMFARRAEKTRRN